MTVRCCRSYEEVHEGDVGRVVKLDRDNLHDLNVQVDWQRKGGTYWVRYIHVELFSGAAAVVVSSVGLAGPTVGSEGYVQVLAYLARSIN
jgi:E3 ubiquitin-protein ligase HERC2